MKYVVIFLLLVIACLLNSQKKETKQIINLLKHIDSNIQKMPQQPLVLSPSNPIISK
jgi:hypothetical protein